MKYDLCGCGARKRNIARRCRPCAAEAATSDVRERFDGYTLKQDGCWLWMGLVKANGYGVFFLSKRRPGSPFGHAHRVAWEFANGRPVPDGMQVMHACDNRRCVNPAHLSLGTHADNMRDMTDKRRHWSATRPAEWAVKGTAPHLDSEAARQIRESVCGTSVLAERFGVSATSIRNIRAGRTHRQEQMA